MKKFIYSIIAITLLVSVTSCDKESLEPTLAQIKDVATSIKTVDDLQGILFGAYNRMTNYNYYGRNVIIYGEVRSDNAFADGNSARLTTVSNMDMLYTDSDASATWTQIYTVIASTNVIIGADLDKITGDATKIDHIIGQAYAIRALAHFDLLRIYGQQHVTTGQNIGVPYVKTYKGSKETLFPIRNTVAECKQFIMEDLTTATSKMSTSLNDNSKQLMTTYGAQALAARVALYFKDWTTAKSMASIVIASNKYSIIDANKYAASWSIDGSVNSIFELGYSNIDNEWINGLANIYRYSDYGDVRALPNILTIFDDNDVRGGTVAGTAMIDWDAVANFKLRNIGKYPSRSFDDNVPLIRYEEVILIYAEAALETGDAATALIYLNMVPAKRGANLYTIADKDNILLERRKELCFEGFRFDDLARTNSDIPLSDPVLQTHGGPAYGSYKYAFPIPQVEMLANSNMVQNYGY
ncbi:MAG: RagB/SusD family nutrient uptake outer membrane protein [Bacteroidetes bacterium]|nr:RagB/SusD family nutrient uptake outer membrane protein [Bacteroidota bacterium]